MKSAMYRDMAANLSFHEPKGVKVIWIFNSLCPLCP